MMMGTHRLFLALASSALLLLTGCDFKLIGQKGVIDFHPDDCGSYTLGCSFEKPIAVGGTIEVRLDGDFGSSKLTLRPEDETLLSVTPSESGNPTRFTVRAQGSGTTLLKAVNQQGDVVDQITVETLAIDALRVRPFTHMQEESETDIDGSQVFRVPQDKVVAFWIGPDVGDDWDGMGKFVYELVDAPQVLKVAMEAEAESNDVESGFIAFRMPEGSHQLVLGTTDGAHLLSVLFVSE